MPNFNNPFGFQGLGIGVGGAGPSVTIRRTKLAANTDVFYRGDVLAPGAAGDCSRTFTPGTTPVLCVSDGYYPASTAALVASIPVDGGRLFRVQSNGDLQRTHVNLNANIVLGTGNAVTNNSGDTMNISTVATTNTLDLKIHELIDNLENTVGNYGIAIVSFNRSSQSSLAVGV